MHGDTDSAVLLIVPPFYAYGHPSLGTAVLKSALKKKGISSAVLYANALYARRIGVEFYRDIMAVVSPDELYQEQIFSPSAHGVAPAPAPAPAAPRGESFYTRYYALFANKRTSLSDQELARARDAIPGFLAAVVEEVRRVRPRIVGLSSLYSQVNASLAIARAVKQALPEVTVVIGGTNCYGEMGRELARFAHVDYLFDGEADLTFPAFCENRLAGGEPPADRLIRCAPVESLEDQDLPDYDDFLAQYPPDERKDIFLYLETSRGCWWGVKNRCQFCGISYEGMSFRTMSPRKAAAQLCAMRRRYPEYKLYYACDSVFPDEFFDEFFDGLTEGGFDGSLFYQIKPMFDIDRLRKMKAHGVDMLGPGIESLSTRHLKMMKKGTTAATNIAVLRNCKELGIEAKWNHLVALPNDAAEDYDEISDRLPLLQHLDPPIITPIYLQRYSPYFDRHDEHGITGLRPMGGYGKSFPGDIDLMKLAYNFDGEMNSDVRSHPEILARFMLEIGKWYDRWSANPAELVVFREGKRLLVRDTRDCAIEEVTEIDAAEMEQLRACRSFRPRTLVDGDMSGLVKRGFVAEIDGGFLTLVCGTGALAEPAGR